MLLNRWISLAICLTLSSVALGDSVTITKVNGGSISQYDPEAIAQNHYYALTAEENWGWARRPVLKFDMNQFSADDVSSITGVTFKTYVPDTIPTEKQKKTLTFTVYAITQAWMPGQKTATWNSLKDKCNTAKPLGQATQVFKGEIQALNITLNKDGVELIKSWITAPETNQGLMIISWGGNGTMDSTIGSEANQPSLIIQTSAPQDSDSKK